MGTFQVQVTVANPASPEQKFTEAFWVDTGALYTFVPEDRLRAIGLQPRFVRDFILPDGRRDRRPVGEASVTIEGLNETITCLVVFAPPGSLLLLGATTLENFSVEADPTNRRLRPVTAVIGTMLTFRPS
jgi:predicted aspartyl protease